MCGWKINLLNCSSEWCVFTFCVHITFIQITSCNHIIYNHSVYTVIGRWIKCEYGTLVDWYWRGKHEVLWEKLVPLPLCPPQIPPGLILEQTQVAVVRGRATNHIWPLDSHMIRRYTLKKTVCGTKCDSTLCHNRRSHQNAWRMWTQVTCQHPLYCVQ
jgi:hypothetical protein